MHHTLSEEEIHELVASITSEEPECDPNDNLRKEFKKIMESRNHRDLIIMIKAIWLQKQKRKAEGKKLHMADEQFFKNAEKLLYDEFQHVLKISREVLIRYLFKPEDQEISN